MKEKVYEDDRKAAKTPHSMPDDMIAYGGYSCGKLIVNAASPIFGLASWVIEVVIGCRHSKIRY